MASMVALFSTLGENIPIFKREKILQAYSEGYINRLHYRATCLLIMAMTVMVTCPEWISGEGTYIECMHGGSIPDSVINQYCWIQGTFVVPRMYKDFDTEVGWDVSQTGVGPYSHNEDIKVKAYYQWVPFVLFLQGIMFYVPHMIYKWLEGDKVKGLIGALHRFNLNKESRGDGVTTLAKYLVDTLGDNNGWSIRTFIGHSLYLINVIFQIFFTDLFLGYEFSTYGVSAASFVEATEEGRTDPMSRVFPRVTKCTFHKYGPSGNIQKHDAQCVLPINILNEKIYIFLWFWFLVLTVLTVLDLIHHFCLMWFDSVREIILRRKLRRSPKHKVEKKLVEKKIDIALICRHLHHGDWILIYSLIQNMDSLTYAEWTEAMTRLLREAEEDKVTKPPPETFPLLPQMSTLIL